MDVYTNSGNLLHLLKNVEANIGRRGHQQFIHRAATRELLCRRLSLSTSRSVDRSCHKGAVISLDLDAQDHRFLLSSSLNGTVAVYDLWDFKIQRDRAPPPSSAAAQNSRRNLPLKTADNRHTHRCISVGYMLRRDGRPVSIHTVRWYPVDTGMLISATMRTVDVWDSRAMIVAEKYSFDNKNIMHIDLPRRGKQSHAHLIAAGVKNDIRLIDMRTGSNAHTLSWQTENIARVAWSPLDENLLLSGDQYGRIMLWDIRRTNELLSSLDCSEAPFTSSLSSRGANDSRRAHTGRIFALNFNADGSRLVSLGADKRLRMWNMFSGGKLTPPTAIVKTEQPVEMALSNDPAIAFVPVQNTVQAIMLKTTSGGLPVCSLAAHFGPVNSCVFDENMCELYTAAGDNEILRWSADRFSSIKPAFGTRGVKRKYSEEKESDWDSSDEER